MPKVKRQKREEPAPETRALLPTLGLWDVARDGHEGFGHEDPCGPDAACLHQWQPDLGTQETVRLLAGLGGLF